jgi:hypothetical protein
VFLHVCKFFFTVVYVLRSVCVSVQRLMCREVFVLVCFICACVCVYVCVCFVCVCVRVCVCVCCLNVFLFYGLIFEVKYDFFFLCA